MIITISLLLISTLYVLNYTYDQLLIHLLVDYVYYPPLSLLMVNIQNGEESLLFSKWGVYMRETGDIELYLLSDVGMHMLLSKWSVLLLVCAPLCRNNQLFKYLTCIYLKWHLQSFYIYSLLVRGILSPSWYLLENCLSFLHSYPFYYFWVKNIDIERKHNNI